MKVISNFFKKIFKNKNKIEIEKLKQEIDLINYKYNKKFNELSDKIDDIEHTLYTIG